MFILFEVGKHHKYFSCGMQPWTVQQFSPVLLLFDFWEARGNGSMRHSSEGLCPPEVTGGAEAWVVAFGKEMVRFPGYSMLYYCALLLITFSSWDPYVLLRNLKGQFEQGTAWAVVNLFLVLDWLGQRPWALCPCLVIMWSVRSFYWLWDWFCAGHISWAKRCGITSSSGQLRSLKPTFLKKSWISWRRSLNSGILWISEFLAKILFQITCRTTSIITWPCGQSKGKLGCDAGKAGEFTVLVHLLLAFGLYNI